MTTHELALPSFLAAGDFERLLDRIPLARLATVSEQGLPHLVPIVFARANGAIWMPIDGKPKSTRRVARLANIAANPNVALLIDEYSTDWSRLWWLRIDAIAQSIALSDANIASVREALSAKYPQYGTNPKLATFTSLVRFSPRRVTGWIASADAAPV
ncbi:MAG: TIGR03668 family PPOX class F420-dependent oxidoreductase [Gammaproteobacteria bacterium]|nr:TIGR03668 family PPOX class F420-dependent oxidoreductase [Gammaproteobacteria bacterium]